MKTLWDIEERTQKIERRMKAIRRSLKTRDLNQAEASNLAEEFSMLLSESEMLESSINHFREMAEQLLQCNCSGPH
jgi:predicted  nucleic acid-binding Zn-ribbon protein